MAIERIAFPDAGDLHAEPGTRDWAVAVRLEIQSCLHDRASNAEMLEMWLKGMREHGGWRTLKDQRGKPFASYAAFCKAPPPFGLGKGPTELADIIEDRRGLGANGTNQHSGGFSPTKPSVSNSPGRDYWLARMERDASQNAEVAVELDAVQRGASSARAAAVRLGWRSPKHCRSCQCFAEEPL